MNTSSKKAIETLASQGIQLDTPELIVPHEPIIETVANNTDIASLARSESFMNEIVKIRLATTTDVNAPPHATVTVNDVNNRVHLPRGVVLPVKRLHVEVLARMRETRFTQPVRNMMDPEAGNFLIPHHAMVYPFELVEDKNPAGRAWLEAILTEPSY